MRKRLTRCMIACALITACLMCLMVAGGMYVTFSDQLKQALVREADTVTLLETPGGIPERTLDLAWLRQRL